MPKCTCLLTDGHFFLSGHHVNPTGSKLQNAAPNTELLLTDWLQTLSILEQIITGIYNTMPDLYLQIVHSSFQITPSCALDAYRSDSITYSVLYTT